MPAMRGSPMLRGEGRRLTPKRVDLAEKCLASLYLPQKLSALRPMKIGNAFHDAVEVFPRFPNWPAITAARSLTAKQSEAAQARYLRWRDWAEESFPPAAHREFCVALDLETMKARTVECDDEGRPVATSPVEMVTKLDALLVEPELHVYEWKSGWYVEPPENNTQTQVEALMVTRLFDRPEARVTIVKCPADGDRYVMPGRYDVFDLDEQEARLIKLGKRVATGAQDATAGAWCKSLHCDCRATCAAYRAYAAQERQAVAS